MLGSMQKQQLTISAIIEFADKNHPNTEVVSNTTEGGLHRYTYGDAANRSRQLANALTNLGVQLGDRIATLAWNGYRHLELYYGISGIGAICHTINPRLFPEQVAYILNHAEDSYIFVDLTFMPLVEALAEDMPTVKGVIVMTDEAHMPETTLTGKVDIHCYESLIAGESTKFNWPEFDENTASCLCYTSGTTGNPKGVLYSHRSTILHAFAANQPDVLGLKATDVVMPVVPMFHVNAWGTAYIGPMAGAKLVFPGAHLDGESVQKLMESEKVTFSAGVPTIWLGLLQYLRSSGKRIDTVDRLVIGGSACPRAIIEGFRMEYNAIVDHAWGMTELSPLGTFNKPKAGMENLTDEEYIDLSMKQGRGMFGIEMRIVDDEGNELPWDGKAFGSLQVRGPWVCESYYKGDGGQVIDEDKWFSTGDVSKIDPDGYMIITDRTKDVIKSGGEWISSIDLENVAVGHEAIQEAAVIGIAHKKWDERPLLVCVKNEGMDVSKEDILAYMDGKIAKWWMPDDVAFVDELPHTATGKLSKLTLRGTFKDYKLPTDE